LKEVMMNRASPVSLLRLAPATALVGLALVLVALPAASARPEGDPFAESNRAAKAAQPAADDPFAEANRAKALAGRAPAPQPAAKADPTANLLRFDVSVTPAEAKPGQVVRVTITGTPKEGYHTYPLTRRTEKQDEAGLSQLRYEPNPQLRPLWPVTESEGEFKDEGPGIGVYLEHAKPFSWAQDVLVLPTATPGKAVLKGTVALQVCKNTCVNGQRPVEVPVTVLPGPATPLTPELQERLEQKPPEPTVVPVPSALAAKEKVTFEATVQPARARPGQKVRLTVTGTPAEGYHTFPLTQRTAKQDPALLSTIHYQDNPDLKPLFPVTESKAEFVEEKDVGPVLEHRKPFTWAQDVLVSPEAKPGTKSLRFTVKFQACREKCVPGEHAFDVPVEVYEGPDVAVVAQPTSAAAGGEGGAAPAANNPTTGGLHAFLGLAIFWGGLSLLTPCVFPMIPITVSFFIKQSEKAQHSPLAMAGVYSGTIVVVLTAGGLLLMPVLRPFSQHYVTNVILGGLFLVFALSLFGMFEIVLPSRLANLTSAQEGRGGLVGTMFMALTFTIISFTCVAPFYGGFIALAASAQSTTDWLKLVLGALLYSITFASPFFLLALFPSLLRSLPKSGSWMNTVKVVMGFLELAAAFKFFRGAELNLLRGHSEFLTYDLVLGGYVALCLACGLYLLNLFRLPHDHGVPETLSVPRLLWGLAFLTLGCYLLPGLFKLADGEQQRPRGTVFAWIDSFLLPDTPGAGGTATAKAGPAGDGGQGANGAAPAEGTPSGHLVWLKNLQEGLKQAGDQGKRVFIDFTGFT
jgi:thiol:disulfide interchange protein DsbD